MARNPPPIDRIKNSINSLQLELSDLLTELQCLDSGEPSVSTKFPGELPYRVIHLIDNPCDSVIRSQQSKFEELKQENERLKARLTLIENGRPCDLTLKVNDAVTEAHQVDELKQKIVELRCRQEKILSSFGKTIQDLRQAYHLLLGYRIEAFSGHTYKLTHSLSGCKLAFRISPRGDLSLIENEHSMKLTQFVETYLRASDSYPAFLAAVTLHLFRTTTKSADATKKWVTDKTPSSNPQPVNIEQVEELKRTIKELEQREVRIVDSFKKTSREFREVCYLLTGYRLESLKDGVVQMSNMYAEQENDKLMFKINGDEIQLLENDYTKRLSEFIGTYLEEHDSFPAFLAAITLDLFKSSTQTVNMSMTMSTTVMPDPRWE